MYGLTDDADLNFLTGLTLLQVCFGQNELILNFSEDISVSIFSSVGLRKSDGTFDRSDNFVEKAEEILVGLGKTTTNVTWTREGTISFFFSEAVCMQIYDDSSQFESVVINGPNCQIVI